MSLFMSTSLRLRKLELLALAPGPPLLSGAAEARVRSMAERRDHWKRFFWRVPAKGWGEEVCEMACVREA